MPCKIGVNKWHMAKLCIICNDKPEWSKLDNILQAYLCGNVSYISFTGMNDAASQIN